MARRIKITITTASNLVVVQDYETVTGQIYQMKAGGFGEYTMAQYANVDLTNSEAMIAFIHSDGTTFQAVAIESIESITINGVAASIADLEEVRAVLAPYFFSVGGGGYSFYKEITITSAMLKADLAIAHLPSNGGGIEIFPAVANTYYDWKIDHELHFGTLAYTVASQSGFYSQVTGSGTFTILASLPTTALNFVENRVVPGIVPQMTSSNVMPIHNIGERIVYKLANNLAQATGDGYVKLKVWYNIRTFG